MVVVTTDSTGTIGAIQGGTIGAIQGGPFGRAPAPIHTELTDSKELESEAFTVPIDRLIDLWTAKYGNEWVDMTDIATDVFFSAAYKRLKQLGEVETHYLTDRSRYVCRKPT